MTPHSSHPPVQGIAYPTLASLSVGRTVKIHSIDGGIECTHRLAAMGLYPGTTLKIVQGGAGKPLIVDVRGGRVMIGRGMIHRIHVIPIPLPSTEV